jgi:DNA primase (bacterial type)
MPMLSPYTDITSLIEQYAGIQIVGKPSYVHGVLEYHSNCPFCGGRDRFVTRPETGQYSCAIRASGCGAHGDMITFLREYAHMTLREACETIGIDPDELGYASNERRPALEPAQVTPPAEQWQKQGQLWIHTLRRRQTLSRCTHALDYLHARGFSDASIQKFHLQYIPAVNGAWIEDNPEHWGLSPDDFKDGKMRLPEGILIPWQFEGQLWKLEVRRLSEARPDMKIVSLRGSKDTLFNLDAVQPGKPVVLCESASDAIAGDQACGDLAAFVATGGVGKARCDQWINLLAQAPSVLVAFDDDEPDENGMRVGDKGAEFWTATLPNAIRWVPDAHDLNDMLKAGKDIREWLKEGMETYALIENAKNVPVKPVPQQPEPEATPVRATPDHEVPILRLLQLKQLGAGAASCEQGSQAKQQTCCSCSTPAEHFSPSGDGYCTEHYVCAGGHVPRWVEIDGLWLCACVAQALGTQPVRRDAEQLLDEPEQTPRPAQPVKFAQTDYWQRIHARNAALDPAKPVDWFKYGFKKNAQGQWYYERVKRSAEVGSFTESAVARRTRRENSAGSERWIHVCCCGYPPSNRRR